MMGLPWRLRGNGDAAALRCLLALAILYGAMSVVVYHVLHMRHVRPLGADAPPDAFSEARVVNHIRHLTVDIDGRQEGRPGLDAAAEYIKVELGAIASRAGPEFRIEIEETLVSGSFNITMLRHKATFGYRNHKNIVFRISSNSSSDDDTSFLVNGHYDSPLSSPGAADCGSCVASMLELARVMVDSKWVPPRPVILLFNGAEELFLLGSHGFLMTNKLSRSVGAFIDLEASGSGGPDLVVQSGPGSWPAHIYAKSAKYPMANSVAQDLFAIVPGDTDYRIFAEDYGDIPGLDIIFVLGGYFYHTSFDTVENLMPGCIQARGENLLGLVKAFANSPMLLNAEERSSVVTSDITDARQRPVFFDYLTLFMVIYPHGLSVILHCLPLVIYLLVPFALRYPHITISSWVMTFFELAKGTLLNAIGVILAMALPAIVAVLRLLFTRHAMSWFAHQYLAFAMFVPCSLIGLLLPRTLWTIADDAYFWGAYGLYALMTMGYVLTGLSGGFLTYLVAASMLLGHICFCILRKRLSHQSIKLLAGYVVPLVPCVLLCLYSGGFLVQFLIEKMGMAGSLPEPYGYFVQDVIVATVVGLIVWWCFGPLAPVAANWLARSAVLQVLLQFTVVAVAVSSQFFPYSVNAPKRIVLQHTFVTTDVDQIVESSYNFFVLDANSLSFVFDNSPDAANWLRENSGLPTEEDHASTWVSLYPVSFLLSKSRKYPASTGEIKKQYEHLPRIFLNELKTTSNTGHRKVHLELYLGSLSEIWATFMNVTGPLSGWSFANGVLPDPETMKGGPPSYFCRLSGKGSENWTFWLEANSLEALRVDVAVVDQRLVDSTSKLRSLFPKWADIIAFNSFFSTYEF